MANFGTRQNNDKDANQVSVNTKSFQFMPMSNRLLQTWAKLPVLSPKMLRQVQNGRRHRRQMLSIRINPALEKSKQVDGRVFDYDKYVATSLTKDKVMMLLYKIEKDIKPAITAGEDKTVGVQVGGDSLFVVGTGVKMTGSVKPFAAVHKSLNPD